MATALYTGCRVATSSRQTLSVPAELVIVPASEKG
jgi:hypothetical protein